MKLGDIKNFGFGLGLGAIIGTAVTFQILDSSLKEKLRKGAEKNLSENVVSAREVMRADLPMPKGIVFKGGYRRLEDIDDSYILAYAHNISGLDWKIPISASEYLMHKEMSHRIRSAEQFVNFVTYDNEILQEMASSLTKSAQSKEQSAQLLLDFVHQHMYDTTIEEKRDYVKYPIETLVERNGDCEDLSILAAALMKSIGIDVALVDISGDSNGDDGDNRDNRESGHIALAIHGNFEGYFYNIDGKKYFYAEATGTDWLHSPARWHIGEMPEQYKEKKVSIYIVK